MSNYVDTLEQFKKVNLLEISTVELTKWIRSQTAMSLSQALSCARLIKEAHRLGEIRGRALR